jgi:hypothetical protein
LKALTPKAKQTSILIATGALSGFGTTLAYLSVYIAALKYVLPQCHFTKRQLQKAETKSLPIIIARCGYNRHTARALRYAPTAYAGCGFISWYTLQSKGQICLFLKHWWTDTIISKTRRIALAWSQWQTGFSHPILQQPHKTTPHLKTRWIKSLQTALSLLQGQILIHSTYVMPPEREHDIHIMVDWVCQRRNIFQDRDIKIINYC